MSERVSAFSVSPMSESLKLEPGEDYSSYIKIVNPVFSTETLHYKITVVPYSAVGGTNVDGVDLSENSAYSRIMDWVEIEKTEGELEPNGMEVIHYTIHVPEDAKSGGQYCALAVQNVPEETAATAGVSINDVVEIAAVFYSQVGEVIYEGAVREISATSFSFSNVIAGSVLVENTGNIHQVVQVTTAARSVLTGEPVYLALTAEDAELVELGAEDQITSGTDYYVETILPETTKYITHTVQGLPVIGIFDLTQTVNFSGEVLAVTTRVVICPIWFISICLVVFSGVVFGGVKLVQNWRARRRKKLEKSPEKV